MPLVDETAEAVYSWFNNSQLRDLALAAGVASIHVAKMTSRHQAIEVVRSVSDRKRLALLAHRVEAISPYKHCVLLEAASPFTYSTVVNMCRAALQLFDGFSALDSSMKDLHAELCIDDKESERLFIKFAHMVEVYEFKKTPDGLLKTPVWRRHVVVAQIDGPAQIVSVSFPGFSQPVHRGTDRVTYSKFAVQVVTFLKQTLAMTLEGFKAKSVTDILLEDVQAEVVDLKRTLRFQRGGKMDLDSESDQDAATSLSEGLIASGIKVSPEAIRLAFRSSEAQAIVLLWRQTGLITRFSFRDSLPEILFIWNEAEPSLTLIHKTLFKLAVARTLMGPSLIKEALTKLFELKNGDVVRPTWLEQQFALTYNQALKLLLDECSANRVITVFRMRPDRVAVSANNWVESLVDLPRHDVDANGDIVLPSDPSNIEIAFKRAVR